MISPGFNPGLLDYIRGIEQEFEQIPAVRVRTLEILGDHLSRLLGKHKGTDLLFICTHNSRRSQFGQLWAHTAALYYGIENIGTFSGGTQSDAFSPRAVAAVERAGFIVETVSANIENPHYNVKAGSLQPGIIMFSKKYDDPANPSAGFCAIMVCSDADNACPSVRGAEKQISLPYEDPKAFDGTGTEKAGYDERCRQIACELFYLFDYVRQSLLTPKIPADR